jgi:hypothetical protein
MKEESKSVREEFNNIQTEQEQARDDYVEPE